MSIAIQMPSIDPKKAILVVLILLIIVCTFILGRNSKPDFAPPIQTDVSKWVKKNDSLITNIRLLKTENIKLSTRFDSLSSVKTTNHKKVKNDIIKIKNFTPTSRELWRDSVAKSNRLR